MSFTKTSIILKHFLPTGLAPLSMRPLWRLTIIVALIIALGALLWRSPPVELEELLAGDTAVMRSPETRLVNATTTQFSEAGLISYTLRADLTNVFDTRDISAPQVTFVKPLITVYDRVYDKRGSYEQDGNAAAVPSWMISALKGEGSEAQDTVLLVGDVVANHILNRIRVAELNTSAITVQPGRRYAETDKPVTITGDRGTITATGAKIFFDQQRIELLSNVNSRYH